MVLGGRVVDAARRSWASTTLAPVRLPDGVLVLRSPRWSDAGAWSQARLANREWLERAFPAWGPDWAAEQSELAWVQRCTRLRHAAQRGEAFPFVLTLDGALIGEIGVDAVDPVTGAGEASVWMVRAHGSAAVMGAASLLLIEAAFTAPRPVTRILSPVATTSRRGRSPGLRAVGFDIEATVPRRVGSELVDHDLWVLHRTPETVRTAREALAGLGAGGSGTPAPTPAHATSATALAPVVARAGVRELRGAVRRAVARRRTAPDRVVTGTTRGTTLRPATAADLEQLHATARLRGTTAWAVTAPGRVEAVIGHHLDAGTATTEVHVAARAGGDTAVLADALRAVLDDLRPGPHEPRLVVLRAPVGAGPDPELLAGLGLEQIASLRPDPGAGDTWGGEDLWRLTV